MSISKANGSWEGTLKAGKGIMKPDNKRLEKELATLREHLGKLFLKAHSRTINLDIETRGAVPGEAAFTLAAMAIHGYEPLTYR